MNRGVAPADIERAAATIRRGGLVAFPTETVYGLGADATNDAAVRRVFDVKGRPADHPLIVHLADAAELDRWADRPDDRARALAAAFWPGPLTIILRRGARLSPAVTGGRDTVGLRVPDHEVARALLEESGTVIAAPSANRFGRVSPTSAEDVRRDLADDVDVVLDGGPCSLGVESTIVELVGDEPQILRPGGVPADSIEAVLGVRHIARGVGAPRAPGMLASHYAPGAAVELVGASDVAGRVSELAAAGRRVVAVVAADGPPVTPSALVTVVRHGGVEELARQLYRHLRDADVAGADVIVVVPPRPEGLGAAVVDRLRKAAAPRPHG